MQNGGLKRATADRHEAQQFLALTNLSIVSFVVGLLVSFCDPSHKDDLIFSFFEGWTFFQLSRQFSASGTSFMDMIPGSYVLSKGVPCTNMVGNVLKFTKRLI